MMLAYQPIRSLATLNMAAYSGAAAFERISKVIDKEIQIVQDKSLPELEINNSNIKFNNISFKYQASEAQAVKIYLSK